MFDPMRDERTYAASVRERRLAAGLTQEELAERWRKCGGPRSADQALIAKVEGARRGGTRGMKIRDLVTLMDALGTTVVGTGIPGVPVTVTVGAASASMSAADAVKFFGEEFETQAGG